MSGAWLTRSLAGRAVSVGLDLLTRRISLRRRVADLEARVYALEVATSRDPEGEAPRISRP